MNKTNSLIILLLIAVLASVFFSPGSPQAAGIATIPATTSESTGTAGGVLTCGNGAEGSYVELIAATAATSYSQVILITSNSANDSIVDIATGAGGSESVKINNLAFMGVTDATDSVTYALPMTIPSGSRVAARCHGVGGASTTTIYMTFFE